MIAQAIAVAVAVVLFAAGCAALAQAWYIERAGDPFEEWDDPEPIYRLCGFVILGVVLVVAAAPFAAGALILAAL